MIPIGPSLGPPLLAAVCCAVLRVNQDIHPQAEALATALQDNDARVRRAAAKVGPENCRQNKRNTLEKLQENTSTAVDPIQLIRSIVLGQLIRFENLRIESILGTLG